MKLKKLALISFLASSLLFAPPANAQSVMSNGEWTIAIDSKEPWSGVNGTGNFTYQGCDRAGNCIYLENGTATCQFGICTMTWRNGEYTYMVRSNMMGDPEETLIVTRRGQVILEETNFTSR